MKLFKKLFGSQEQDSFSRPEFDLDRFRFLSDDHIRYENGIDNYGHQKGAHRGIQITKHDTVIDAYLVTIYNMDGNHPQWGTNVQMQPKRMKIVSQSDTKIQLRGFGKDALGVSFENYGITLKIKNKEVDIVTLHMFDRKVDIEYFKKEPENIKTTEYLIDKRIQDAREMYNIACDYKAKGDFNNAIKIFKESIELNPNYIDALNNLGNTYSSMEEYDTALKYFYKAAELAPDEPIILNNKAICLMELGKLEEAKISFEKAIQIQPDFFQAYNNLGKLFSLKNDLFSAKRCYEKALEINPFDQKAQLRLYSVNELLNNLSEQELNELFSKTNIDINTNNKDLGIILKKAQIYNLSNQYGDAIYNYNQVLQIDSQSIEALTGLASVYLATGDYSNAIEYAKKAIKINNKSKDSFFNIGTANYYLGNFSIAIEYLINFISLAENEQDYFDGYYIIGASFFKLQDYPNAIKFLSKATQIDIPARDKAYFALANAYAAIGDEVNRLYFLGEAADFGNEDAKKLLGRNDDDEDEPLF